MLGEGSLKKRPSSPASWDEAGEEESLLPLGTGEGRPADRQATTTCAEETGEPVPTHCPGWV